MLLAATPHAQLVEAGKPKKAKGLTEHHMALMEGESVNLEQGFKVADQSYGNGHLAHVPTIPAASFRAIVSYDGLGDDDFSAWGGPVWVNWPLN